MADAPDLSGKRFDWKKVSAIDVNNFDAGSYTPGDLIELVDMIACCSSGEFRSPVDPNLLKLFRISQTLLSFLLTRLEQARGSSRPNTAVLEKEKVRLESENRKLRKVLQLHQRTFESGLSGTFKCSFCPKVFMDQHFLDSHTDKRHHSTALDSAGSGALDARIADFNAKLGFDKQAFDQMTRQLEDFRKKVTDTEVALESEKKARSDLESKIENEIRTKFRDLEHSLSEQMNANTGVTQTQEVRSDTQHLVLEQSVSPCESHVLTNFDAFLSKHTHEVQKLGKEIVALSNKLETSPNLPTRTLSVQANIPVQSQEVGKHLAFPRSKVRVATDKKDKIKSSLPLKIDQLVDRELQSLAIDVSAEGIDQDCFNHAIKQLKIRRNPFAAEMHDKVLKVLAEMTTSDVLQLLDQHEPKSNTGHVSPDTTNPKLDVADDAPEAMKDKDEIGDAQDQVKQRSVGILKSPQKDMEKVTIEAKKNRRISFSEERTEISPTDSEESVEDEAEPPVPRPRTSRIKQRFIVQPECEDSDAEFDLSRVDISPKRSFKVTAI